MSCKYFCVLKVNVKMHSAELPDQEPMTFLEFIELLVLLTRTLTKDLSPFSIMKSENSLKGRKYWLRTSSNLNKYLNLLLLSKIKKTNTIKTLQISLRNTKTCMVNFKPKVKTPLCDSLVRIVDWLRDLITYRRTKEIHTCILAIGLREKYTRWEQSLVLLMPKMTLRKRRNKPNQLCKTRLRHHKSLKLANLLLKAC